MRTPEPSGRTRTWSGRRRVTRSVACPPSATPPGPASWPTRACRSSPYGTHRELFKGSGIQIDLTGLCEGGSRIERIRVHPCAVEDGEGLHGPHGPSGRVRDDSQGDVLEIHDPEQVAELRCHGVGAAQPVAQDRLLQDEREPVRSVVEDPVSPYPDGHGIAHIVRGSSEIRDRGQESGGIPRRLEKPRDDVGHIHPEHASSLVQALRRLLDAPEATALKSSPLHVRIDGLSVRRDQVGRLVVGATGSAPGADVRVGR